MMPPCPFVVTVDVHIHVQRTTFVAVAYAERVDDGTYCRAGHSGMKQLGVGTDQLAPMLVAVSEDEFMATFGP